MACQGQKRHQDEGIKSENDASSSWETLRFSKGPQNLLFSADNSEDLEYFETPAPTIKRKLFFSPPPPKFDTETSEAPEVKETLPVFASSPVESASGKKKNVSFKVPHDISRISPKNPQQSLQKVNIKSDIMAEDDDIIIIEENGESPKEKKKSHKRSLNNHHSSRELCVFEREIITEHDYKTLADEEFLNDNIINFYLTWLYQRLSPKYKNMVYIYSSYFYSRLKYKPPKKSKEREKNKDKSKQEMAYERVKSWTKSVDIFDKRMLIIPICEESHWYVVIVCNPGYVLSATREKEFEKKRSYQKNYGETKGNNPFIMVLDSLGGSHSTAVSKIRSYLTFEHLEKKKIPKNYGKEKMGEKHPPIPLQPNSCDCGLFLLHYVELIFKDPDMFLGAILPDLSKWFNTSDVEENKREEIADLIQKVAQTTGRDVRFPRIKFPSREGLKKRKREEEDDEDEEEEEEGEVKKERKSKRQRQKEGSFGELLASNHPDKFTRTSRRVKFTGTYREVASPERSTSPTRKSSRLQERGEQEPPVSPYPELSPYDPGSSPIADTSIIDVDGASPISSTASPTNYSPKLFDSPTNPISFQIKKKNTAPKMPHKEDFDANQPKVVLNRLDNNGSNRYKTKEKSHNTSWESIDDPNEPETKAKKIEVEEKYKKFLLKRNNPETNPDSMKRKNDTINSRREMLDLLNKATKKKK